MDIDLPNYPKEVEVFPASKINFSSEKCYKYSIEPYKNEDKMFSNMNKFKYLGKYSHTDSLNNPPTLNFSDGIIKKDMYLRETICRSNGGRKSKRKSRRKKKSKRKFLKY